MAFHRKTQQVAPQKQKNKGGAGANNNKIGYMHIISLGWGLYDIISGYPSVRHTKKPNIPVLHFVCVLPRVPSDAFLSALIHGANLPTAARINPIRRDKAAKKKKLKTTQTTPVPLLTEDSQRAHTNLHGACKKPPTRGTPKGRESRLYTHTVNVLPHKMLERVTQTC